MVRAGTGLGGFDEGAIASATVGESRPRGARVCPRALLSGNVAEVKPAPAAKLPPPSSRGCQEIRVHAKRHGGLRGLGRLLALDESTVRHWIRGSSKPSQAGRSKLASCLGIRAKTWDEQATKEPVEEVPAVTRPTMMPALPPLPENPTGVDLARQQVDRIRIEIEHRRGEGIASRELASLESSYVTALRNLAKVSGDGEISHATILRHPAFMRMMRIIREWLERHGNGKVSELASALEEAAEEGE